MLAEYGGGDEGDGEVRGFGDLLPGQVLADLGVNGLGGQGLTGGVVELGVHHEMGFLSVMPIARRRWHRRAQG
ncbi:hypothetical protein M2436_000155 [Streptomyces sp. HB372]|nr:hypothetical protein [Streptomyces sp. HB372]